MTFFLEASYYLISIIADFYIYHCCPGVFLIDNTFFLLVFAQFINLRIVE